MAKVLVVDDSPTEIFQSKDMLEGMGYEVITAENGRDGVEMAKKEQPDCVLMDIVMPDMNGFQATRQIAAVQYEPHTGHHRQQQESRNRQSLGPQG